MAAKTAEAFARELEAQLDEYPDERGEILLEAAHQWRLAGEHDHAIALLNDAVVLGGADGDYALVSLADLYFELGRDAEALAQLAALRQSKPASPAPYHLAGELMESRGESEQALTWFNMAVARLSEEEMATRRMKLSYAGNIIVGRLRVRKALGLPPDELDEAALAHDEPVFTQDEYVEEPPRELRVLFWPRNELPLAHETWPGMIEHTDAAAVITKRQVANREMAERGIPRITMVPLTVAKLVEFAVRTGGDPMDEDTRMAYGAEVAGAGGAIDWPPPRNAPCWCGSDVKYKKCCGRPNIGH